MELICIVTEVLDEICDLYTHRIEGRHALNKRPASEDKEAVNVLSGVHLWTRAMDCRLFMDLCYATLRHPFVRPTRFRHLLMQKSSHGINVMMQCRSSLFSRIHKSETI